MAKGQKRSTSEIRKPKKDKAAPKPEPAFGNAVKLAAASASSAKPKRAN